MLSFPANDDGLSETLVPTLAPSHGKYVHHGDSEDDEEDAQNDGDVEAKLEGMGGGIRL